MLDIYFDSKYGKLCEGIEGGVSEIFEYKSELGEVKNMFIKREIPQLIDNVVWYDITTPYGYGGPVIIDCLEQNKKKLVQEYEKSFKEYCQKNKIVTEFIRFHPILNNAQNFKETYDISYLRNTVGTNLYKVDEFSRSAKKGIRNAVRAGLECRVVERPSSLNELKEIYYSTMDRNQASNFYYFDEGYFEACIELFKENIILIEAIYKGKVIAMELCLIFNQIIHRHLTATLSEFTHLSPSYLLVHTIVEWGKGKGCHLVHHGGGRSNSSTDGLYLFKKKFGRTTDFAFYIGKKVHNIAMYDKLCQLTNVEKESSFFPLYRSNF